MMQPIEEPFRTVLPAVWGDAGRVLSNFTGTWHTVDPTDALVRQVSGRVRWVDNMRALEGMRVVEVGPSRPLRAFFRALGVTIESVTNVTTADRLTI
jgi:[acyl-carrier-protein] S-malonyltransferase/trans-AT polyketide synthase/acyltransferase/oxidoreductase domain-containing protein